MFIRCASHCSMYHLTNTFVVKEMRQERGWGKDVGEAKVHRS